MPEIIDDKLPPPAELPPTTMSLARQLHVGQSLKAEVVYGTARVYCSLLKAEFMKAGCPREYRPRQIEGVVYIERVA